MDAKLKKISIETGKLKKMSIEASELKKKFLDCNFSHSQGLFRTEIDRRQSQPVELAQSNAKWNRPGKS